jgi:hypothetical protein
MNGLRDNNDGTVLYEGTSGHYWSSTVNDVNVRDFWLNSNGAGMSLSKRANGLSCRCIKD